MAAGVLFSAESHFARDEADRAAHARFLAETLPKEIAEVSFTAAR